MINELPRYDLDPFQVKENATTFSARPRHGSRAQRCLFAGAISDTLRTRGFGRRETEMENALNLLS